MDLPYHRAGVGYENQVRRMIDQGWVWGAAGDGDVGGVLAWGGEPERDLNQISMVLFDIEVWQGRYEGRSHD